jgi:hypothetical protein
MRYVCAWCGAWLGAGSRAANNEEPISHGICPACAALFNASYRRSLREFLDSRAESIIVIDDVHVVITANACARAALGKGLDDIEGVLGGDAMGCVNASLPGGCGRTVHCAACETRGSVTYTVETGFPLRKVEAYMDIDTPQGVEKRRLFISTEKVGAAVLVRIDAMQKTPAGEPSPAGPRADPAVAREVT